MKKEIKWLITIWILILGADLASILFLISSNVSIRFMMLIPFWIRYIMLIIVHGNMIFKIGFKKSIDVFIASILLFILYSFSRNCLISLRYNSSIISQIKPSILDSFYYYLIPSTIGLIISAIAYPKNK